MNKFFGLIVFLLVFTCSAYSQKGLSVINSTEKPMVSGTPVMADELPKPGTYQIVFKNSTPARTIEDTYLFLVNKKREFENEVIIVIDSDTELRVIPYKLINDPTFTPPPTIIFE